MKWALQHRQKEMLKLLHYYHNRKLQKTLSDDKVFFFCLKIILTLFITVDIIFKGERNEKIIIYRRCSRQGWLRFSETKNLFNKEETQY